MIIWYAFIVLFGRRAVYLPSCVNHCHDTPHLVIISLKMALESYSCIIMAFSVFGLDIMRFNVNSYFVQSSNHDQNAARHNTNIYKG